MKSKKALALFLAGSLLTGVLAGCGADTSSKAGSASAPAESKSTAAAQSGADTGAKPYEGITLTMLKDSDSVDSGMNAVIALAEEKLGMKVDMETRVGGSEGDNVVKTRLASGDMADLCIYNTGSLLAALNPAEYFIDISGEAFVDRLDDTFKSTVSIEGATYGVPFSSASVGAVMYNKKIYADLGLSVPSTWDEFIANCDVIQATGTPAVIGTFADGWTSQVMYLGDNYNVISANPDFAAQFEAGDAKYATTPAGVESFQKLVDVIPYYNADYLASSYDDGCDKLAMGEGAHWVMLSQVLTNIYELYPEEMDNIGVFGIPGDDPDNHGLTVWMPSGIYGNKNTEHLDAVKAFMELYITNEALDAYTGAVLPDGPYCVKDYDLPDNAYKAVRDDMQTYFDTDKTITALEFMTAVKGPNCDAICQEVGSGQTTAQEAAAAYDEDCKKQAMQLGLNWE